MVGKGLMRFIVMPFMRGVLSSSPFPALSKMYWKNPSWLVNKPIVNGEYKGHGNPVIGKETLLSAGIKLYSPSALVWNLVVLISVDDCMKGIKIGNYVFIRAKTTPEKTGAGAL